MKHWHLAVALICLCSTAQATPYFRGIWADPAHPVINVGACADVVNVGHSQQCTLVNAIGHSHKDGYLLFPGEDWSLLGVGYSASGTGAELVLGPSWNIAPAGGDVIVWTADTLFPNSSMASELHVLASSSQGGHLNGAFGPAWAYDPVANHGYFRVFAGATWAF